MPIYVQEAYAQLIASASLFILSTLGLFYIAAKARRRAYKALIWTIGLLVVVLSTMVVLETASLVPR